MASYLLQQRTAGFTLGAGASALLYLSTKRHIWRLTAETADQLPGARPAAPAAVAEPEPLFGPATRAYLRRQWNQGVDTVTQPLIAALWRRDL